MILAIPKSNSNRNWPECRLGYVRPAEREYFSQARKVSGQGKLGINEREKPPTIGLDVIRYLATRLNYPYFVLSKFADSLRILK